MYRTSVGAPVCDMLTQVELDPVSITVTGSDTGDERGPVLPCDEAESGECGTGVTADTPIKSRSDLTASPDPGT